MGDRASTGRGEADVGVHVRGAGHVYSQHLDTSLEGGDARPATALFILLIYEEIALSSCHQTLYRRPAQVLTMIYVKITFTNITLGD